MFSQSFAGESKTPAGPSEGNEKRKECNLSTPRKRLLLSRAEKEKLLTWDVLVTADETPNNDNTRQHKEEENLIEVRTISLHVRCPPALYLTVLLLSTVLFSGPKMAISP